MNKRKLHLWVILALMCCISAVSFAVSPEFAELHQDRVLPDRDVVLKKILFVCGQINACFQGLNDLVAALQMANKNPITA